MILWHDVQYPDTLESLNHRNVIEIFVNRKGNIMIKHVSAATDTPTMVRELLGVGTASVVHKNVI
jgi:hypothetical protein